MKKYFYFIVIVMTVTLLLYTFNYREHSSNINQNLFTIKSEIFIDSVDLNGKYITDQFVDIYFKEQGVLSSIDYKLDDVIKTNTPLAKLDQSKLQYLIDIKTKNTEVLKHWISKVYISYIEEFKIDKEEYTAKLVKEKNQFSVHIAKIKIANVDDNIKRDELEKIKNSYKIISLNISKAIKEIEKKELELKTKKLTKELELTSLKNDLSNLQIKMNKSQIYSSFNALIVGLNTTLIKGDIIAKGTYLATLKKVVNPYIEVVIPSGYIDYINTHNQMICTLNGVKSPCYFDNVLYKKNQSSQFYIAQFKVNNYVNSISNGQLVNVQIIKKKIEALAIHRDYLEIEDTGFYAYKKIKNGFEKVKVEIGLIRGDYIQLINGITKGEKVRSLKHD